MTIYEELVDKVSNGSKFTIDFKNKTIKVNGKPLVENGIYPYDKGLIDDDRNTTADILSKIEELYKDYRYSVPNARSESKKHRYFQPLRADEMTDAMLCVGCDRELSQAMLEGYILVKILSGQFKWDSDKWFWQSENQPDLVILREWVC